MKELIKSSSFILDNPTQFETSNDSKNKDFIWCLVGNVIENRNINGQLKFGTKLFSSKTKVYCFPVQWGDGYENIKVIGRHRNSKRFICAVMKSKFITNWRIQKVFNPNIINKMKKSRGWSDSEEDKETIIKMLKWLPEKDKLNY